MIAQRHRPARVVLSAVGALLAIAFAAGPRLFSGDAADVDAGDRRPVPAYPLKTCVVTGLELGAMGPPIDYVHEGRLVRFCCQGCIDTFRKDPARYLAQLDAAAHADATGRRHPSTASPAPADREGMDSPAPPPPVPAKGHEGHGAIAPGGQAPSPARSAGPAKGPPRYYCPMHPTYTSDRPGDCPICNMSLVLLKDGASSASGVAGYATVTIRPEQRQLIGVTTGLVERKATLKTIRAAGRVDYDERTLSAVNLKVGGWIEELFVKSAGETVRKGQPLFLLYSPDLLEAQTNYLLAREAVASLPAGVPAESRAFAGQALRSARDRLLLWDVAEEQIRAIEEKGEPLARLPILSKTEGIVTRRNVVQGTRVEPGRDLLEIADLSTVWIHADVYEYEIPEVTAGLDAVARLTALPDRAVTGKVAYVYPYLNEPTRTVRVRVEAPNADGALKPGMYAEVSIRVDLGSPLVVEDGAVMDTGTRQIVFVDLGEGRFEPREVTLGPRADGVVVVTRGLKEGDRVVTSGNFLIDSESRIKSALLGLPSEAAGGGHSGHAK